MKVVAPPRVIVIELTEEEATVLCALAGGVPFNFDTTTGHIIRNFFDALNDNLPERKQSFVDFFDGWVMVKR